MKDRYTRTIWYNTDELERCWRGLILATSLFEQQSNGDNYYPCISSSNTKEITVAVNRVIIWKRRCENGKLPHFIEVTSALSEILFKDAQLQQLTGGYNLVNRDEKPSSSPLLLRFSYAAAIIRGVNGIADSMQRHRGYCNSFGRSSNPASVAMLCSLVGLPSWVVDLRHDSAHNELPSLTTLRLAAKTLVNFLSEHYWEKLVKNQRSEPQKQKAIQILTEYENNSVTQEKIIENIERSDDDNKYGGFSVFAKKRCHKSRKKHVRKQTNQSVLFHPSKFIKQIPMDVGVDIALRFLLYDSCFLISNESHSVQDVTKTIERYRPLLETLCFSWPGFAYLLLSKITDYVLSIDVSKKYEEFCESNDFSVNHEKLIDIRKLYFLKYWFRFLLSKDFHIDMRQKSKKNKKRKKIVELRNLAALDELWLYPIQGLYHKCVESVHFDDCENVKELMITLKEILVTKQGNEPHATEQHYLASQKRHKSIVVNDQEIKEIKYSVIDSYERRCPVTKDLLLRDEANNYLNQQSSLSQDQSKADSTLECWTQCTTWEACSLGRTLIHQPSCT